MNGGPICKGISYWAVIKISGEMETKALQDTVKDINAVLAKKGGKIVIESRVSDKATVELRASYGHQKKP
jgi:hypothetical protein